VGSYCARLFFPAFTKKASVRTCVIRAAVAWGVPLTPWRARARDGAVTRTVWPCASISSCEELCDANAMDSRGVAEVLVPGEKDGIRARAL
jgi:hypothetical protein